MLIFFKMGKLKNRKEIVCEYCGHKQRTMSKLGMVTCSSCQLKTTTNPKKSNKNKPKDDKDVNPTSNTQE